MKPPDPHHVEKQWREFAKVIDPKAPQIQKDEMRMSFIAGYYQFIVDTAMMTDKPDSWGMAFMSAVEAECKTLLMEIKKDLYRKKNERT